jgi:hypothetical protein
MYSLIVSAKMMILIRKRGSPTFSRALPRIRSKKLDELQPWNWHKPSASQAA